MIYIFDIDGTVADIRHRLHFIKFTGTYVPADTPADWDGFFAASANDEPIWEVITAVRALHDSGQTLIASTGRPDSIRELTEAWLRKYRVPFKGLYMRKAGDHREDNMVKGELLDQILKEHPAMNSTYKLAGVFEDRQQVVDMYRARGIRVFQVAPGNF